MTENTTTTDVTVLTPTTPENLPVFSPQETARILDIKTQLNIYSPQAVITFGVGAQRDIAAFADSILNTVRANSSSDVGSTLNDLILKVKETGIDSINEESFLQKIPIFGDFLNPFNKFISRYEKISVQIENISDQLEAARMQLLRDITLLEKLYTKNEEYRRNLELYISAGESKLQELTDTTLPTLQTKSAQGNRPEDVHAYNDLTEFINRLDKKLTDLKLSRMIALQTDPQIRLIQSGNQALFDKIQSAIVNTIPLWKNQVVIAITLFRQRKALKLQKGITDATNQLLENNAATLRENTIGIAKETQRGIVDITTLKKVNSDLIATIEAALQIQADGKTKRQQAEQELLQIEGQLKGKLESLNG